MGTSPARHIEPTTLAADYMRRVYGLAGEVPNRFNQRRYPEVVSAVQEALELMVKAMCLACNIEPPKKHRMDDNDMDRLVSALVEDDSGEDVMSAMALLRTLFMARFWSEFYTLAKYGSSVLGAPSDLFRREEAMLAKKHLAEALRGWLNLLKYLEEHDKARVGDTEAGESPTPRTV